MTNFLPLRLCASLLTVGVFVVRALAAEVLPVLQTKTETYINVTVVSRTATHVFVQHSRGVANIKLQDFDAAARLSLGLTDTNAVAGGVTETGTPSAKPAANISMPDAWKRRLPAGINIPEIPRKLLVKGLGIFLVVYLCFSYCAMLICRKAGQEPGFLVWLPVLKIFPLLRAAGMSGWWFLAWLVPVVNVVAFVLWAFKIARARGKGVLTAILLILPGTNLFAFLYLAFSGNLSPSDDVGDSRDTEPLPA